MAEWEKVKVDDIGKVITGKHLKPLIVNIMVETFLFLPLQMICQLNMSEGQTNI